MKITVKQIHENPKDSRLSGFPEAESFESLRD
jgi:hypothetical protein